MQVIDAEADSNHSADWCSQTLDQHIGVRIPGGSQILNLFNHLLVDGFPGVPLINDFSKITAVVTFFADRALAAGTQKTTLRSLVEQPLACEGQFQSYFGLADLQVLEICFMF